MEHFIIDAIAILASLIALFYSLNIIKKSSGGLRKAYGMIGLAALFILIINIVLLLLDIEIIQEVNINVYLDLLLAIISILILASVAKIKSILSFMPKSMLESIGKYL